MSVRTQSPYEQLQHLPDHNLFELMRNDSTMPDHRDAAVQLLDERRGSPLTDAPATENAVATDKPGPFKASVTTETMQSGETVDNARADHGEPGAPVQIPDEV